MDQSAAHADELAVGGDTDVERPVLVTLLRGVGEVLAPILDPFDRVLRELGRRHHRDVLGIDAKLGPEAAAHVRRRHAQPALVEIEQRGQRLEQVVRLLGRGPDRHGLVLAPPFGDQAATFDRMRAAAMLPDVLVEHVRGLGEGGIDVAEGDLVGGRDIAVELAAHRRRAGRTGPAAVRHRGQHVVVDLDQRRGVLGEIAAVGDHDGDRLAHVGDFSIRQRERPVAVERRAGIGMPQHPAIGHHRQEIVEREHRVHARQRQRCLRRNATHRGVGVRAAHEGGVPDAREHDVVDIAALADKERAVLDARNARSNQRRHCPTFAIACCLFGHRLRGLLDDRLGRGIKLRNQFVHALGVERIDIHALLLRLVQEFGIAHGPVECRDQRGLAVGRNAGRRRERPRHLLAVKKELEYLHLLAVLREVERQRHVRQLGLFLERGLVDDVDLLLRQPLRMPAFQRAPGHAAEPVHLAALHRQHDVVGAVVAGDQLPFGAEHVLVEQRVDIGVGPRPFAPHVDRLLQRVLPGLHRRGRPGETEAHLVGDAAEPVHFRCIEGRAGRHQERRGRYGAPEGGDGGAVLGRGGIEERRRTHAAGPGHVLRNDRGIARDVLRHVAGDQASVEVVAAAHAVADQHGDGLALVEVLDPGGSGRRRSERNGAGGAARYEDAR